VKGEPTGLSGLDKLLGGGQRLGEVTCWHAEAKTGKNTLWHKLMHLWLSRKEPVAIAYASRELTPESEVLPNLLSLERKENAWLADVRQETTR
jgi:KaiC/GvpD/RAD55 family RecA-like ATPase